MPRKLANQCQHRYTALMPYLEKSRPSESLAWFIGVLSVIAVAVIGWNAFIMMVFLLAQLAGMSVTMGTNMLGFLTSILGLVGAILLLVGLILLARRLPEKRPWLATGCQLLIAKNVVDILNSIYQFLADGTKSEEVLIGAALFIGAELAQLIFWGFVLWLMKTWVPHMLQTQGTQAATPRLQGAQ